MSKRVFFTTKSHFRIAAAGGLAAAAVLSLGRCGSGISDRHVTGGCPTRHLSVLERFTDVASPLDGTSGFTAIEGLDGAQGLALAPDDRNLYVASASDNSLIEFDVGAGGGLTVGEKFKDSAGAGFTVEDGLTGATNVIVTSDGTSVLAVAFADDAVLNFDRNSTTGDLTINQVFDQTGTIGGLYAALDGATYLAASPDAANIYVGSSNINGVGWFARDSGTRILTDQPLINAGDLTGISYAGTIAFSPDGGHAYVPGLMSNTLHVASRVAGDLVEIEAMAVAGMPGTAVVSPDGRQVYVLAQSSDEVHVYSRDSSTGELTLVETHVRDDLDGIDEAGEVPLLDSPRDLAITSDGCHALVTANSGNAILLFRREEGTGRLSFQEGLASTAPDGRFTVVQGLAGAMNVEISGDGTRAYVAAPSSDTVSVLSLE